MTDYPKISEERLQVIDNIRRALEDGDTFRKVELHDPTLTDEQIQKVLIPFDILKKNPITSC